MEGKSLNRFGCGR